MVTTVLLNEEDLEMSRLTEFYIPNETLMRKHAS